MTVCPAKTQISLGIRPVWSESLLCAQWVAKDPIFLHADNEDSDQTGWMARLIWVFAGCTAILLVLSRSGSCLPRHTKSCGVLCYTLRTLSVCPSVVRPSVCLSISSSFPCSNFLTFWPIFFKLCIDIGIGEEWYGIASGIILFWNKRVMALDVCQKCFALRFRALTSVPFYRFSSTLT